MISNLISDECKEYCMVMTTHTHNYVNRLDVQLCSCIYFSPYQSGILQYTCSFEIVWKMLHDSELATPFIMFR